MKKVMVGVTVALAFTSQAVADGIDRRPPAPIAASEPIYNPTWTGFYIGAGVGGGDVVHDTRLRDVDFGTLQRFDGIGGQGVFGTAIVGWDAQLGPKTVIGAFVDYDFSDISTDLRVPGFFDSSLDHDWTWSVGGRLGWLATPSALLYATGGYSQARFSGFSDLLGSDTDHKTFNGWFAGGGIETRLAASNWFARLEYRFTQFDRETFAIDEFTRFDSEPSMQTVRATLTYKFNGPGYGYWNGWGGGWGR
jgi:outer membrane immunogenic protein